MMRYFCDYIRNLLEKKIKIKKDSNSKYYIEYPRIKSHLKIDFLPKSNGQISAEVLERLLFRHSILEKLENIESEYEASTVYIPARPIGKPVKAEAKPAEASAKDKPPVEADDKRPLSEPSPTATGPSETIFVPWTQAEIDSARALRSYRLATTDLFVEKAIAFLEEYYRKYIFKSNALFIVAFSTIFGGIFMSYNVLDQKLYEKIEKYKPSNSIFDPFLAINMAWPELLFGFIKSFTFYGFIVLFAVFCVRLGKAMVDQAERLRERRHSLRQGRLYIHLSNGEVTVEDLEKAFDWNVTKGNAFGNMPTEASAPWGSVIKEALKAIPEAFKKVKGSS